MVHIQLQRCPIDQNKKFLIQMSSSKELEDLRIWFDTLDCSVSFARQRDEKMTLERYVKSQHFNFVVFQTDDREIRFSVSYSVRKKNSLDSIEYFAWVECRFSQSNYDVINKLFKKVYKKTINSFIKKNR